MNLTFLHTQIGAPIYAHYLSISTIFFLVNQFYYLSFRRIILIRQICCVYYPQLSKNAQNIRNPVPF